MHYIAIAIIDSENSSLKKRVDEIYDKSEATLKEFNEKSENKSFDEIFDLYKNISRDMSALVDLFSKKLEKPLSKLQNVEFDSYSIIDVFSVDKLLTDFSNKNFDKYPAAIFTPSCEWIKEDFETHNLGSVLYSKKWETKVFGLLNKYKDKGIAVFINCDS